LPKGTRKNIETPQKSRDADELPERRRERYSVRKGIEAIKATVSIEQVAAEYVEELKRTGPNRLVGRCVSRDHLDKTPSLVIYKDTASFTCFGCGIWGDVIDLEVYGGYHAELWTAIIALSVRHGVDLPERPECWHRHQREKHEDRERIVRVLQEGYQRRLYRVFASVILDGIGDPSEHYEESRKIWDGLGRVARHMSRRRMEGGA